jgi:hypothetical protein
MKNKPKVRQTNVNLSNLSKIKPTWTNIIQTYSGVTNEWTISKVTQTNGKFLKVTQIKIKIRVGGTNDLGVIKK